jgi:hypothetical protein
MKPFLDLGVCEKVRVTSSNKLARMMLGVAILCLLVSQASATCKDEFNELLKYNGGDGSDIINDRAFIYYVSMNKHQYDLGNYEYCSEKGPSKQLKYALFALSVSDTSNNDRFIYGGSCVPSK